MTTSSDPAYRAVRSLRVVRAYRPDPIPPEALTAILEAGRWTGSSKNRQGWVMVVVDDPAERGLLASAGASTGPIENCSVAVALVRTAEGNDFDIGRLAQNLMLAAAAHGIGSCPITLHDEDRAAEVLGLDPGSACRYAIALGIPDQGREEEGRAARRDRGVAGRKTLANVVRRGLA